MNLTELHQAAKARYLAAFAEFGISADLPELTLAHVRAVLEVAALNQTAIPPETARPVPQTAPAKPAKRELTGRRGHTNPELIQKMNEARKAKRLLRLQQAEASSPESADEATTEPTTELEGESR